MTAVHVIRYVLPVLYMTLSVHISGIAGNGPESKTTCTFRLVRQVAEPGAKSAVSDCVVFKL